MMEEEHDHELFLGLQVQLNLEETNEDEEEFKEHDSLAYLARIVREITGYEFNNPILLQQAFTHHSYEENCSSYEGLDYVGDAALELMITKDQYCRYPDLDKGQKTRLRAANVNTEKLARAALKHELHKLLRHKKPLLEGQIKEFKNAIMEYPEQSSGLVNAPKVLADIFESLVGAIFIDSNSSMDTTWKIVKKLLQPMITPLNFELHPVTMLYEICQKKGFTVQIRDLWRETGEIEFLVDGEFVGRGKYSAKRTIAYHRAAKNAYHQIVQKFGIENSDDHLNFHCRIFRS